MPVISTLDRKAMAERIKALGEETDKVRQELLDSGYNFSAGLVAGSKQTLVYLYDALLDVGVSDQDLR